MNKWILGAAAAGLTLVGSAAMAQPYGYSGGSYYGRGDHGYGHDYRYSGHRRGHYRDSDRDGVPDRVEWNRDRDRDGRPDQYDRFDNRRDWRHHRRHYNYSYYDSRPYRW